MSLVVCILAFVPGAIRFLQPPASSATTIDLNSALADPSPDASGDGEQSGDGGAANQSPADRKLRAAIRAAANAKSWPELDPGPDDVTKNGMLEEDKFDCSRTSATGPCQFGNPSAPTMVVLGDSTGLTLIPTVRAAYAGEYFIRGLTLPNCVLPIKRGIVGGVTAESIKACDKFKIEAIARIKAIKPAVVFISTVYREFGNFANHATGEEAIAEWAAGLQSVVDQFKNVVGHVIIVSPPVDGKALQECDVPGSVPADCEDSIHDNYSLAQQAEKRVKGANVRYYDTSSWFCVDLMCPIFVGNTPVRRDAVHITPKYAKAVAPLFKAKVDRWIDPKGPDSPKPKPKPAPQSPTSSSGADSPSPSADTGSASAPK